MAPMRMTITFSLATAFLAAFQSVAFATASDWVEVEGGRVRLVTAGAPDAGGKLQGALEIDLRPGWKTYWRDPGDAGVPPQIDVSKSVNVAAAEMRFPPPERIDDGFSKWAGYRHAVAFPIIFSIEAAGDPIAIEADVFLGICETICIPVRGRFALDPANAPDNADDRALVAAAFAALPGAARADFKAVVLSADDKRILVEAVLPEAQRASVEVFIAGADGYMFGTPERTGGDGKTVFAVPVLERPATKPAGGGLHYTLATPDRSVEGTLPYP